MVNKWLEPYSTPFAHGQLTTSSVIHVPTAKADGSPVSDSNLLDAVYANPRWKDIHFTQPLQLEVT